MSTLVHSQLGLHNKAPQTGGLHLRNVLSSGTGGWKSEIEVLQGGFLLRPPTWLVNGRLLVSSHGLSSVPVSQSSLLKRTPVLLG